MESYSDMELVNLVKGGNAHALEHLFERHYMTAYGLAVKWCGVREDAEDIAQDVFVKLVRKLHTFGKRSSFKTWFYRIIINTAMDFDRKHARKRAYESIDVFEQNRHNPIQLGADALETARLFSAIDTLPSKQKQAVMLVFGEGLSHKETAQALNCQETTISWRIYQARRRLKKLLKHEI